MFTLFHLDREDLEESLKAIDDVATKSLGLLCVTEKFRSLSVPLATARFESARQKADLAATLLQDLGVAHHNGPGLLKTFFLIWIELFKKNESTRLKWDSFEQHGCSEPEAPCFP
ncbi:hypothetical protein GEV33_008226 [Tenebrio molitor]|uniref:Uncharacterized protein n=1 Tax=Tenebrio molitor TaxID=7067 RepID=A0A8J6HHX5_TENMO|nr:hypothetical protein GEV33_008226 [Tenebrio molitor]